MRTGNRILFGAFVVVLILLIGIPVLSSGGLSFYSGLLPMVLGTVLFIVVAGTIIKVIRRQ